MSHAFSLLGLAVLAGCLLAVAWASRELARAVYPDRPWSRVALLVLTMITTIALVTQTLGTFGLLRPTALTIGALAASGITYGIARLLRSRSGNAIAIAPLNWPFTRNWTITLVAITTGVFVMSVLHLTTNDDALVYHYPMIAQWMQSGSLTDPGGTIVGYFTNFYPSNVQTVHLWLVAWTSSDLFFGLVAWASFIAAFAAIFAMVRYAGDLLGRATIVKAAPLVALVWSTVPIVVASSILTSGVDSAVTGLIVVGITFGLRWWVEVARRSAAAVGPGGHRDLYVAALALGWALGAKYVAVPYVGLLVCMLAVGVVLIARSDTRRARSLALPGLSAVALIAMPALFWYVRNLLLVGNPIYPGRLLGIAGGNDLAGLAEGYKLLDHTLLQVLPTATWRIMPFVVLTLFALLPLVVASVIYNPVVLWRRRYVPSGMALFVVLGVLPALFLLTYALMPETGLGPAKVPMGILVTVRYGMPAFVLALIGYATATLLRRDTGRLIVLKLVLGANLIYMMFAFFTTSGQQNNIPPPKTIIAGIVTGLAIATIWWASGHLPIVRKRPAVVICSAVAVVAIAALAIGVSNQTRKEILLDTGLDKLAATPIVHSNKPVCVAYSTNVQRTYPLYGDGYRNRVLLAADEVATGTYRHFTNPSQLVAFLSENRCDYFLTRNDDIDSPEAVSADPQLALMRRFKDLDSDPAYRAAMDAWVQRWIAAPEYDWAKKMPRPFHIVGKSGPFVLYRYTGSHFG